MSEKRACVDTIEESSSSAEEADARKKRARFYKESSLCIHTHPVSTSPPSERATAALTTRGITSAPLFTTPSTAASSSNLKCLMISFGPRGCSVC